MTFQEVLILLAIGFAAGAASGFIGIGGGVIMVPALIYFMGMTQHAAQGTSLLLMLPPIGILAVANYWRAGEMNWKYGIVIAIAFVLGGYFGSKLALKMSPAIVRLVFGILMLYISLKLIYSGYKSGFGNNETNHTTAVENDS